ncbi:hypothetical protein [Desulfitobacterium metallireducens]|uniref:Type 4 fimbrial biogenesis protein PilX N-terminal domain-containing protein n=1 Tax=Desulfitobacterium metallireducens DSM 15288 TaxID=871968 RepID=W0EHE7_9FIRM|nr:hypothetical protein [Desulfitobacterium metallireducens]AHF08634.1 hypothetical protein DESME_10630 [Desulfitobacterium metallireducens DSM 15288]
MRDRGSALLTSVIAIMVFLMISGIMFSIVNYNHRLETSEEQGLRAYYLAEAGANYGIAMVKTDVNSKHAEKLPTYSPFDTVHYTTNASQTNPLGLVGDFDVTVTVDKAELEVARSDDPPIESIVSATYIITVKSTGYYPDRSGIKRTIQKQYTFTLPYREELSKILSEIFERGGMNVEKS